MQNEYDWDTASIYPYNVNNPQEYFYYRQGYYPPDYQSLVCACNDSYNAGGGGNWVPNAIWSANSIAAINNTNTIVTAQLTCEGVNQCISCSELTIWENQFAADAGFTVDTSTSQYNFMLSNYISQHVEYHIGSLQLGLFEGHCETVSAGEDTISMCTSEYTSQDEIDSAYMDCINLLVLQSTYNAKQAYQAYADSAKAAFYWRFVAKCTDLHGTEYFEVNHKSHAYQTTLYYYDQSGLLVRTIPPNGYNPLPATMAQSDLVNDARSAGNNLRPSHTEETIYRYNSLNGLIETTSPDGGDIAYWYDYLGRLVLSQNEKQKLIDKAFSYTLYDELGRIKEIGQTVEPDDYASVDPDTIVNDTNQFRSWIFSGHREQITRTFYDNPINATIDEAFGSDGQRNVRLRVATTAYFDSASCDTCYRYASHFSYDIHGNVNHMIQDIKALEKIGHRFKHIEYEYDLISGNINAVHYQQDETDGFHHRYHYDADNRIAEVETSPQEVIWASDAKYFYYDHGPLARVERGEYKVQGEDIAYTINGWIKGTNSVALDSTHDMGNDAHTDYVSYNINQHKWVGTDAMSYNLGYFDGAYETIGDPSSKLWQPDQSGSGLLAASSNLHNGNIPQMITNYSSFPAQAMAYTYDQMNRLVEATAFQNMASNGQSWNAGGALSEYNTNLSYDANGNIQTLIRNGGAGTTAMDDFNYRYLPGTNQLDHVDDAVSSSNYSVDIDDQDTLNNTYYGNGALRKSISDSANYLWNAYGKLDEILRLGTTQQPSIGFDYDPQGNRVYKALKPRPGGKPTTNEDWEETWYVHDLKGNILATYESTYTTSGEQGLPSCGYVALSLSSDGGGFVDLEINGSQLTSTPVAWITDAATTACLVANSINSYSSIYEATCNNDTIWICSIELGTLHDGDTIDTGASHSLNINVSTDTLSGGREHTLVYNMQLDQDGHHLYGSSRLGVSKHVDTLTTVSFTAPTPTLLVANFDEKNVIPTGPPQNQLDDNVLAQAISGGAVQGLKIKESVGDRTYEYTNHLGNVLLTTNDKRIPIDNNTDNIIDSYIADVKSLSDYYPYGMPMVGRNQDISSYRFGMNGMEMDNEHNGNGNTYTSYYRAYDSRIARWFSTDPVTQPSYSPYNAFDDNPIFYADPRGDAAFAAIAAVAAKVGAVAAKAGPILGKLKLWGSYGIGFKFKFLTKLKTGLGKILKGRKPSINLPPVDVIDWKPIAVTMSFTNLFGSMGGRLNFDHTAESVARNNSAFFDLPWDKKNLNIQLTDGSGYWYEGPYSNPESVLKNAEWTIKEIGSGVFTPPTSKSTKRPGKRRIPVGYSFVQITATVDGRVIFKGHAQGPVLGPPTSVKVKESLKTKASNMMHKILRSDTKKVALRRMDSTILEKLNIDLDARLDSINESLKEEQIGK
ncbi:MAG: hypothetical protein Salg2KO_16210 [Salibacteraceae bacterium]